MRFGWVSRPIRAPRPVSWALIIVSCALLHLSCEESRTLHVLDGESQNLGGAPLDPTGSGGSEPLPGCDVGTGGPATPITLIDDFVDCDGLITTTAGRCGSWYHFAEPAVSVLRVSYNYGPAPDTTWSTGQCGIYLSGECPTCESAGVGFQLAPEGWDLSQYSGIRVSFESETSLWSVIVTNDGTQGYSEYVELLPTGGMSAERILSFADIYPGNGFQGLAHAREVQFTVGEGDRGSFAFGIHRVELVE